MAELDTVPVVTLRVEIQESIASKSFEAEPKKEMKPPVYRTAIRINISKLRVLMPNFDNTLMNREKYGPGVSEVFCPRGRWQVDAILKRTGKNCDNFLGERYGNSSR